ncbi:hypothetical protein [Gimesia maris]|uniref:hypothetical protein n=1 Tax=Gimesia maris TaxID=122 RepID=UPI000153FE58|nr:hypothetical protein [Gimesia maris]EDL61160.1 hypothetical protein PM8797T_02994 [Gimesia maris DSM 8797]|tara:strand:+ start:442 stop:648 length:207 start_codon:yes stop_codon:yes gene_type:complete
MNGSLSAAAIDRSALLGTAFDSGRSLPATPGRLQVPIRNLAIPAGWFDQVGTPLLKSHGFHSISRFEL